MGSGGQLGGSAVRVARTPAHSLWGLRNVITHQHELFDVLWFWKSYRRWFTAGETNALSGGDEAKGLQVRLKVLMWVYIQDKTISCECSSGTFNVNAVVLCLRSCILSISSGTSSLVPEAPVTHVWGNREWALSTLSLEFPCV